MPTSEDVTRLLQASRGGDAEARDRLAAAVFGELRRIAAARLRGEQPGATSPTVLVNEAYLRLMPREHIDWQSRSHFFGFASHVMRQVLVDHARRRRAEKRGGRLEQAAFADEIFVAGDRTEDVLAVHEALDKLAGFDERQAKIVEMHFFAGMTVEEIAAALDIGSATVKRELSMAKAYLARALKAAH